MKTADILKSVFRSQVINIDDQEEVDILRSQGFHFTWPDVRDTAWMAKKQIRHVLDNPQNTMRDHYVFEWSQKHLHSQSFGLSFVLVCLCSWNKYTQPFIDCHLYYTLVCMLLSFYEWNLVANSVCAEILSAEDVKADKIWFNTDTLQITMKRYSFQAWSYQFQPWQKTVLVIYCHYGFFYNSLTSSHSLVYFLLCKKEIWK